MADLFTHIAIGHLIKRASPRPEHPLIFALGTSLPDMIGRAPGLLMYWADFYLGWRSPSLLWAGLDVFHIPVPFTVFCLIVVWFLPLAWRRTVFWNLLLGGYLHFAVDLTQRHIGSGYRIFFPFSWVDFELRWVGTEASVYIAPFVVAAAMLYEWRFRRRSSPALKPPAEDADP